jgi:hypothetical protein
MEKGKVARDGKGGCSRVRHSRHYYVIVTRLERLYLSSSRKYPIVASMYSIVKLFNLYHSW